MQPEYYGLLTFAGVAPAGSRLLRISDPGRAHVYAFAVRAPDRSERVVLTNVGAVARTIGDTTLAGQSLSSRTGQLTGTPHLTAVRPNAKGVYTVRVPAHAAAILTLSG